MQPIEELANPIESNLSHPITQTDESIIISEPTHAPGFHLP